MSTRSLLRFLAFFALLSPATASPPGWWSPAWWFDGVPPVITGDPQNNEGPANIGQAKWMVSEALRALDIASPSIATQVRADLAGTQSDHSDRIIDLTVPADPKPTEWSDKQKAPLLRGQLKAISAPFYTRLDATNSAWLAAERASSSNAHPDSIFPWTTETDDDANKAIANIGQLKAVFSLRFETLSILDSDGDGLADDWELQHFGNLGQIGSGDFDQDGLTNLQEYLNGTNPLKPDTDDDGMDDQPELATGLDPKSNDENHNGQNDGFEDFDDDDYINRDEALCGTDARNSSSKPDGSDNSFVPALDAGGGGSSQRVIFIRDFNIESTHRSFSTYSKYMFREFETGIIDDFPPIPENSDSGLDVSAAVEKKIQDYPKAYKSRSISGNTDYHFTLDQLLGDAAETYSETGSFEFSSAFRKVDGLYIQEDGPITGTITFTRTSPYYEVDPPLTIPVSELQDLYWYFLAPDKIFSGIQKKGELNYSEDNSEITDLTYATRTYRGSTTETLDVEYTEPDLIADLVADLAARAGGDPDWNGAFQASFLWTEDRSSASMTDIKYRVTKYLSSSSVQPGTKLVFRWKEISKAQEDGLIKVKWLEETGVALGSGICKTEIQTLPHPSIPGTIEPQIDGTSISGPSVLAAINLGEPTYLDYGETDADGQKRTIRTIQRARAIRFQAALSDQRSNPMLTATGTGAVILWELKKDGQWQTHTLPFNIPAEQAAGASSDPGSYLLQATAAGPVTLAIKVGGVTRGSPFNLDVISADVDIDSDNSGQLNLSNDEEKIETDTIKPGKIIIVNPRSLVAEGNVPSNTDGLVEFKVSTANLTDSDTVSIHYAPGAMNIWKTTPNQVPTADDLIDPNRTYTPSELGLDSGAVKSFSIQAIATIGGISPITVQATKAGTSVEDVVLVSLLPVDLAVDADRDGEITFDGKDKTTAEKPFRFWINNDDDPKNSDHDVEEAMKQDETSPPYLLDWRTPIDTHEIEGVRDLEDFARMHLSLPENIVNQAKDGNVKIGFKWVSGSGPRIRIYKAESDVGDRSYLFYKYEANTQCDPAHRKMVIDVKDFQSSYLPSSYWQGISSDVSDLGFLFEGCTKGLAKLVVIIKFGGSVEVEGPGVWIKLMDVQEMFERGKVASPMSEPGDVPDPWVTTDPLIFHATSDPNGNAFQQDPDETKQCITHVHGWRMSYDEAQTWANTSFKRLWHLGYKGRFAFFSWPTYSPATSAINGYFTYNQSEYRAWLSGVALKSFVETLPSDYAKNIMAHSMGNVVVGSAFREGMGGIANYALLNAATAAQCYDPLKVDFPGRSTPDTDDDLTVRQNFGLSGKFSDITARITNFYLEDDFATGLWNLNHEVNKPNILTDAAYGYDRNGFHLNDGSVCNLVELEHPPLAVTYTPKRGIHKFEEALAYVTQTRSLPAGRTPTNLNMPLAREIDLDRFDFGYDQRSLMGSVHSAQWLWSFQRTYGIWKETLISFKIAPTPPP